MRRTTGEKRFTSLCSRLDAEWRQTARSVKGRAAVRRWIGEEPVLAGACSGEEVVEHCHRRDDAAPGHGMTSGPQATFGALLRLAGHDEFAERTVIQAMLPGLLAMRHRLSFMVSSGGSRWGDHDELEQEIVSIAYERVQALAGTTQAWPARTLLDQTWRRLRVLNDNECRWRANSVPVALPPDIITERAAHSPAEELAHLVVDAVQDGTLALGPAQLVYTCAVMGQRVAWVASTVGCCRWSVSGSIARSARVLAAAS